MHSRHDTTARQRAVCFCGGLILLAACAGPATQRVAPALGVAEPGYRIERHEKVAGAYERLGADQVRIGPYWSARIEREDDAAFYVRVYADAPSATDSAPMAETPPQVTLATSQRFELAPAGTGLPRGGQWRNDFALADLDGDQVLDVVAPSPRKSFAGPQVYRHHRTSGWQRWSLQVPELAYDYGASAVHDFDHDGQPDLALAMHLRGFTVLRQTAPGSFTRMDQGLPLLEDIRSHGVSGVQLAALPLPGGSGLLLIDEGLLPSGDQPRPNLRAYRHQPNSYSPLRVVLPNLRQITLLNAHDVPDGPWLLGLDQRSNEPQVWVWRNAQWHRHLLTGLPQGCVQWAGAVARVDGDATPDVAVACLRLAGEQWWSEVLLLRARHAPQRLHGAPRDSQVVNLRFATLTLKPTPDRAQPDLVWVDLHGNLQLLAADGSGGYTLDHAEPAPAWRAGCRGYGLHAGPLTDSAPVTLIAGFAGEASPFVTGPSCVEGGGLDAWTVTSVESD